MSEKEIIEGNKLIAEFMGLELAGPGFPAGYFYINVFCHFHELNYHANWNWLMPVWIKINGLYKCIEIKKDYVKMDVRHKNSLSRTSKYIKYGEIGALYRTVVEFIKWYNTQNK